MSKKRSKYAKQRRFNPALLPLMGVLGLVPLIVHLYSYEPGLEDQAYYYSDSATRADFFLAGKMILFNAIVFAMAGVVIYKLYKEGKKIRFEKIFIPLGVYAFLALLSSIVSSYQPYPFTGIFEQFENVFALMGYAIAAYYAYLFVETEKDLKLILGALTFSAVCMLLIGVSQAFFTDFYKTRIGAYTLLPISQWSMADNLTFNFEEGRVYMTLYNPNYVGSYVAFLFPIYLMLGLNKWKKRIIIAPCCIIIAIGMILALLGSQSRSGFVGVILSVLILLIVFNKKIFRHFIPVLAAVLIISGVVIKMNADADNYYLNRLMSIFNTTEAVKPNFSAMSADGKELLLTYKDNTIHVEFDYFPDTGEYSFLMTDDNAAPVEFTMADDGWLVPDDERFSALRFATIGVEDLNTVGFCVNIDGKQWNFVNEEDGVKYLASSGKTATPYTSETFGPLEGKERMASGRGFIWGKTIPLLKDNIILGSGADTFTLEFPNDDFRSTYYGGYQDIIISKPHNMYLQVAVQTGVVSLIAILVFYGWYFVLAIITYARIRKFDMFGLTGAGILCGSFGYMVTMIINDSTITVAPIFWTMMGVGVSLLFKTRKDLKAQIAEEKELKALKLLEKQAPTEVTVAESGAIGDTAGNAEINGELPGPEEISANGEIKTSADTKSGEDNSNGNNKNSHKGSASRKGKRSHR